MREDGNANDIIVCCAREPSAQVSVPFCPSYPKFPTHTLHFLCYPNGHALRM